MLKKILLLASLLLLLAGGQALANSFSTTPAQKISATSTNFFHKIDFASAASTKQPEKTTIPAITAYILPAIVAIIIIIGFSGYWLVFRKRHL